MFFFARLPNRPSKLIRYGLESLEQLKAHLKTHPEHKVNLPEWHDTLDGAVALRKNFTITGHIKAHYKDIERLVALECFAKGFLDLGLLVLKVTSKQRCNFPFELTKHSDKRPFPDPKNDYQAWKKRLLENVIILESQGF